MEILIKTTFFIILAFSVLNLSIFSFIYFSSGKKLYMRFSLFWAALIANFFVQAVAQTGESAIVMGFAFSIIPMNFLAASSIGIAELKYPKMRFWAIGIAGVGLSGLALRIGLPFTVSALPISIAASAPMVYVAYLFLTGKPRVVTALMKMYAFVLLIIVAHNFNFAFFRMDPGAQLWGWPVAYAVYQALAALIPAMSLDFYHRKEQSRLTGIINEKTAALASANTNLTDALMEKTFMFRTLVHDVSNPLMVIAGQCKMASLKNEVHMKQVTSIDSMAKRINTLIQQVKDYEKIRSGLYEPQLEAIDLKKEWSFIEELFLARLEEKNLTMLTNFHEFSSIDMRIEKALFSNSIFPNILSNAIKFSPEGGSIHVTCRTDRGGYRISIRDEGQGMPNTLLESIFDFESKTSRKGTAGEVGTGFGLPIVKMMLDMTGGEIEIESSAEKNGCPSGTIVHLWFPRVEVIERGVSVPRAA